MKRILRLMLALVMILALGACGKNAAEPAGSEADNLVTIMVNLKGLGGNIAVSDDGTEPQLEAEFPAQSAFLNVEKGTVVKILAEPEEGYHFFQWTVDGKAYSTEPLITVTAEEDTEFLAQFLPEGKDGAHVDLDTVKTLGDLLGLPDVGSGLTGTTYVYAFEQDGSTWRAVCDVSEETAQAIFDLDFDDPDYDRKLNDLIAPLPVRVIENLTENLPTQQEADQYLGKTGQELIDDGWTVGFCNLDDLRFEMNHGVYSYEITFDGKVKDPESFSEDTDMGGLTVKTITCDGIGDATYVEAPEE